MAPAPGRSAPDPTVEPASKHWIPAHLREPAIALLILLIVLAAGLAWEIFRAEPPAVWSATRLAGPPVAFSPRISPDGRRVAFIMLIDGNSYVGVMPSGGGAWTVVTPTELGAVHNLSWSPDSYFIVFDRYWNTAHGIYSVAADGGKPALVLNNAFAPQYLPDGTLIIALPLPSGDFQLAHYAEQTGRTDALPAFVSRGAASPPVRVFHDGKQLVFYGSTGTPENHAGPPAIYTCDISSPAVRKLPFAALPPADLPHPLAISADGKGVITAAVHGDMVNIVRLPRTGSDAPEVLFSFPRLMMPQSLDMAADGTLFLDSLQRDSVVLRFPVEGGSPEQTPAPSMNFPSALPLAADFLYPSLMGGGHMLVTGKFGADPIPFVRTNEDAGGPVALAPGGNIAFLAGSAKDSQIAFAAIADGHVVRRIPARMPAGVRSLAISSDGATAYYTADGVVWSLPYDGSTEARRVATGDSVAVSPGGRFLYVKQLGVNPPALLRITLNGGASEAVAVQDLTASTLAPNAVDGKERLVLDTAAGDSFFSRPAVWDSARQTFTRIPLKFAGDVRNPAWTADGRVVAAGSTLQSSLWHYRKQ